ncbi:MAG: glycoside hydrolase 100 family protein [Candidatus Eiseniibacteriota bacterium]
MTNDSGSDKKRATDESKEAAPRDAGLQRAVGLLHRCLTPDGFLASPSHQANYRRVWGRDGVIIGLAALLTGERELSDGFGQTLRGLAEHQGPHGEIPSNFDCGSGRVSYGGTTGRVDADLWFTIGCGEYWKATGNDAFLESVWPALKAVRSLLGAWEFNNRGLIYVPLAGDWADEYIQGGYVLYDELLYLQALRSLRAVSEQIEGSADPTLRDRCVRLRHVIRANYWFHDGNGLPEHVYHEVLYRKGRDAAPHTVGPHWMPFFSPQGYGYRLDCLANVLASLIGVADDTQRRCVDQTIASTVEEIGVHLLPAFWPVIKPVDDDWKELQMTFSYSFKNSPYEYHNGGLWPMITGFYVADLAARGQHDLARRYLEAIHEANSLPMDGEPWGFPEYVHGRKHTAEGVRNQGWSAAGAIIGAAALDGHPVFRL